MRGRKPELKAIEGGLATVPRAPSWLPTEAKDEWRRVLPSLIKRRVLTETDMAAVENYCLAIGTIQRCQAKIALEGDTIGHGAKRHPAFGTMVQMLSESRRFAAELGLTPASRNKARAGKPPEGEEGYDAYAALGI